MKEIIYYEAFDGTRFDDEDECMDYENGVEAEKSGGLDGVILYSDIFGIEKPRNLNDLILAIDSNEYLYLKSKESLNLCLKACGFFSKGLTSTNTLYKWDENKCCWVAIIEKINDELRKAQDIEDKMVNFEK